MISNDELDVTPTEVASVGRGVGPVRRFFRNLGPGLITGAADDDPSGISTYATAGASFGYGLLWTAWVSLPLMAAVQLMCARIGLVSGRGLANVLRRYYARPILWFACTLLLVANVVNIAADLGGMAEAMELLTGLDSLWFHLPFAVLMVALLVFTSYRTIANTFKWLTLVLFAYVIAAFLAHPNWSAVLRASVRPPLNFSQDYLTTLVAILGTTISPYLFFWQAAQEVEEGESGRTGTVGPRVGATMQELRAARTDTVAGMSFSNLIMYFIILTTGATLYVHGQRDIETARQAAEALRPLAGEAAYVLFALGLIGTGMLGVPVLAGSAAYTVAEAFAWRGGMNERPRLAPRFYAVIALSMTAGLLLDYVGVSAIKMLFWSAVLNGLLAPPLIVIILLICNNRQVMGEHVNGWWLNLLGTGAALVMFIAGIVMFVN